MFYTLSAMTVILLNICFQAMNRQIIRIKTDLLSFQLMVNFWEQTNNNQKDFLIFYLLSFQLNFWGRMAES